MIDTAQKPMIEATNAGYQAWKAMVDFVLAASLPIDVQELAKKIGIKEIIPVSAWPDNISGGIKVENDDFIIGYNANHSEVRQRFTIAHELGHYILHRKQILENGRIIDYALYRSNISNEMEVQANRMAADILMPSKRVADYLRENNDKAQTTIDALASKFGVSKIAMAIRMENEYKEYYANDYWGAK